MSAVLRWRCDICRSEAEIVQDVPRDMLAFFKPKLPEGWVRTGVQNRQDLCSQRCVVAHYQQLLAREQRKLTDSVVESARSDEAS